MRGGRHPSGVGSDAAHFTHRHGAGHAHSHLDRQLARVVGLIPRSLARLLRMRRLLAATDITAPINWADLAARFGWFDQSHFIRDFKRDTGVAPSRHVKAQRDIYSPSKIEDAGGFAPDA